MTIPDNSDRPGARIPCETRNVFGFSVAVSSVEEMSAALAERALEAEAPFLVAAADAHVVTLGVHDPPRRHSPACVPPPMRKALRM